MSETQRYPLSWPTGWKRTPAGGRERARFGIRETRTSTGGSVYISSRGLTVADALGRLTAELARLGAFSVIVSSNVQVRLDGWPRSGQPEPEDPGAAVYFKLAGKPRCLACDRWTRIADNLAAIAGHIYAIRAVDRYGVGTMEQAFAGYAALPPSSEEWWLVLGLPREADENQVQEAFAGLARKYHPDVPGGSHEAMARINRARDLARTELSQGTQRSGR